MRYIKVIALIATLAALAALVAIPAWSQDDVMLLNSKPLDPHERPLVKFTHAKHAVGIKCVTCHHNYDQYFNLVDDSEGMACSECHKVAATPKNKVSLTMAFHKQCKNCHHLATKKGKASPVMCGDCHSRAAQAEVLAAKAKKAGK